MYICILSTVENVEAVREKAKTLPNFAKHIAVTIPVSSDGELPPTHYFCTFNTTQETCDQIMALQKLSVIETGKPKEFLSSRNLKIIRTEKFLEAREKGE
jgi:hypothetical protein